MTHHIENNDQYQMLLVVKPRLIFPISARKLQVERALLVQQNL